MMGPGSFSASAILAGVGVAALLSGVGVETIVNPPTMSEMIRHEIETTNVGGYTRAEALRDLGLASMEREANRARIAQLEAEVAALKADEGR